VPKRVKDGRLMIMSAIIGALFTPLIVGWFLPNTTTPIAGILENLAIIALFVVGFVVGGIIGILINSRTANDAS
jgi:predicted Na+-dependent transporter